MKYLRKFNESVSSEISDILLELEDIGFKTSTSENLELKEYFINIENIEGVEFRFSEISDSILRLVDYLSDNGLYLQHISIDNVTLRTQSNSFFDGRHPDGVIDDISNDKLSRYYPDRGGVSSIRPNKVNHVQLYFRK